MRHRSRTFHSEIWEQLADGVFVDCARSDLTRITGPRHIGTIYVEDPEVAFEVWIPRAGWHRQMFVWLAARALAARRAGRLIWLAIPKSSRDEIEGDFWATLAEARRRGIGPVARNWLAVLVVARYACVVLWFVGYRVLKVLVLLSRLA